MRLNPQFNKSEKYIGPGDFFVSREDVIISTLLGSCISVALYDQTALIGGLNHFMLPFSKSKDPDFHSDSARYGINAMEVLINGMLKEGARRERFHAKVFGGGSVLDYQKEATYNVPKMNIHFVFEFLETEKIPVDSYSVGGPLARKILFFPHTAKVLMRFGKKGHSSIFERENRYSLKLQEVTQNAGKPIIF